MKIEEAKSILLSYRATGAEADDPLFAEALALVKRDAELHAWFERQQRFDRGMMAEMEATPVPAGLRDAILAAGAAVEAARVISSEASAARKPAAWRHPALWLGLAAAIAVVAAASRYYWPTKVPAADSAIAAFALIDAQDPRKHGGHGAEAKELNHTLNTPTTRLGDALPVKFQSLRDGGCRTVHIDGRDVLEMCFRRNGVQFHCYIARRDDFPRVTAPTAPEITNKQGAGVAAWADAANLYLVISEPGPAPLQKLL